MDHNVGSQISRHFNNSSPRYKATGQIDAYKLMRSVMRGMTLRNFELGDSAK